MAFFKVVTIGLLVMKFEDEAVESDEEGNMLLFEYNGTIGLAGLF